MLHKDKNKSKYYATQSIRYILVAYITKLLKFTNGFIMNTLAHQKLFQQHNFIDKWKICVMEGKGVNKKVNWWNGKEETVYLQNEGYLPIRGFRNI